MYAQVKKLVGESPNFLSCFSVVFSGFLVFGGPWGFLRAQFSPYDHFALAQKKMAAVFSNYCTGFSQSPRRYHLNESSECIGGSIIWLESALPTFSECGSNTTHNSVSKTMLTESVEIQLNL